MITSIYHKNSGQERQPCTITIHTNFIAYQSCAVVECLTPGLIIWPGRLFALAHVLITIDVDTDTLSH